jgi:hypothetical protein
MRLTSRSWKGPAPSWLRRGWRGAALVIFLLQAVGCGGGSPSDVVLPEEVDVTLLSAAPVGPKTVSLDLASANGRDVGLRVLATDFAAVTGVAFEVAYDDALLEFVGAGPGTFFGEANVSGADVVEDSPGRVVAVAAGTDQTVARDGGGTLLTLQFRLKRLRDGETPLSFGVPQSLVYGPAGVADGYVFTAASLITRIREPL